MPPTPPETETEPEFAEVDPTGLYWRVIYGRVKSQVHWLRLVILK
jgi:hypothetical protein